MQYAEVPPEGTEICTFGRSAPLHLWPFARTIRDGEIGGHFTGRALLRSVTFHMVPDRVLVHIPPNVETTVQGYARGRLLRTGGEAPEGLRGRLRWSAEGYFYLLETGERLDAVGLLWLAETAWVG